MKATPVQLVEYAPHWRDELVLMWRESFAFGVGMADPHSLSEQAAYFEEEVRSKHSVCLAVSDAQLLGFVAASPSSVSQLHVRVACHRQGIGSRLLDWAKAQSGGSLWLYTFARNTVAQAFYEHHGFSIIERGFEPTWQLDDLKYAWSAAGANPA